MHCGFPKYPLKFHQNHCSMTCFPPWIPQPPPSFFNLLLMAWSVGCNLFTLGSLGCCLEREKRGTHFSHILGPIISHPFVTLSRPGNFYNPDYSKALHKIHPMSSLIQLPRSLLHAHHPSQQVSLNKIQAQIIFHNILFKEDHQLMFQAKMSPQRHLQAL